MSRESHLIECVRVSFQHFLKKSGGKRCFQRFAIFFSVDNWKPVRWALAREFINLQTATFRTVKSPDNCFKCLLCQHHHPSSESASSKSKERLRCCHRHTLWSDRTRDWVGLCLRHFFPAFTEGQGLNFLRGSLQIQKICLAYFPCNEWPFVLQNLGYHVLFSQTRDFKPDSISSQSLIFCLQVCLG